MSRAVVTCCSAGSPLGLMKCVCSMPSRAAVWFICLTNDCSSPPSVSAIATAMSLAERMMSACSASHSGRSLPTPRPSRVGGCLWALGEMKILVSLVTRRSRMASKAM